MPGFRDAGHWVHYACIQADQKEHLHQLRHHKPRRNLQGEHDQSIYKL